MTPRDLLARLEAEGVGASLKLRLEGDNPPSPETVELLKRHRDDLIIYLAGIGLVAATVWVELGDPNLESLPCYDYCTKYANLPGDEIDLTG